MALTDKVGLVTAATSGIGSAIARRIVADGGRVALGAEDDEGLAALAGELGPSAVTLHCDATDEAGPAALADLAVERFGGLDLAVANAGTGASSLVTEQSLADWRRVLDLNLTSAFLTVQAAARVMRDGGAIVALSSLSAIRPSRGSAAYSAAKAAVLSLVEVAALELGPRGIRVNAIAPSLVRTPSTERLFSDPELVEAFHDATALGRHAEPEEIAAAVAYLASDEAGFVTGTTLMIDGGAQLLGHPDTRRVRARAAARTTTA